MNTQNRWAEKLATTYGKDKYLCLNDIIHTEGLIHSAEVVDGAKFTNQYAHLAAGNLSKVYKDVPVNKYVFEQKYRS